MPFVAREVARELIAKGTHVALVMADGTELEAPASHAWLHDETGRTWPYRSVLIGGFHKTDEPFPNANARDVRGWFGSEYDSRLGHVDLPPRDLSEWRRVGEVSDIYYRRRGYHEGDWKHAFKKKRWLGLVSYGPVVLYDRGGWRRLEFPRGATINWRGFVRP